ncbi:hypothetical protein SLEP1_g34215 [Rubroshorea leprosula]|uniref:Uncharacterized protein n=1 Tax=Rubroshorea leprosula TaxID=152421 RepID=A0AAV5KJC5_9ROSI|nr:hypothetical protein SLEP1_g34215 [Rubroshorea leprosula]
MNSIIRFLEELQLHNWEIKNGSHRIRTPLLPPLSKGPNTFGSKSTPSKPPPKPLPQPPTPFWGSPNLMIIFSDLARVTAFHLKENDLVCIDGQETSDPPPLDATHSSQCLETRIESLDLWFIVQVTLPPNYMADGVVF